MQVNKKNQFKKNRTTLAMLYVFGSLKVTNYKTYIVQELNSTGCDVGFWLIKKNQFKRAIRPGIISNEDH